MNLFRWLGITKRQSPEIACTDCGWLDMVPMGRIYRHRLVVQEDGSVAAVAKPVGDVVRCARCVHEFVIGPSGPYEPKPGQLRGPAQDEAIATRREANAKRRLRDTDQPWDKG